MRRIASMIAAIFLALSAAFPAQASLTADQGDYTQHVLDCLGLLFSDPDGHASNCGGPFDLVPPSDLHDKVPPPKCLAQWLDNPALLTGAWRIDVATPLQCGYHCGELAGGQAPYLFESDARDRILVAGC